MHTTLISPDQPGHSRRSRASKSTHQLTLEKEANLNALVEHLDGLVWSIDRNMRYIIVNTALRKVIREMTGIDPRPGDRMLDILAMLDPSKAKECKKMYQLGFKGEGQRFMQQYQLNGRIVHYDISINPIIKDNEITGLSCFASDVTEKLSIEAKIKASETRFRSLIENSTDIIILLNEAGQIIYGSPSIENHFGVSSEEYTSTSAFEYVTPEYVPYAANKFTELLKKPEKPLFVQIMIQRRDGKQIWVEGMATNLLQHEGVNGIVCNFRDVTERIIAEEARRNVDLKFRTLIENSAELLMMANTEGKFIYGSPSVKKFLGYAGKDFLQKSIFTFIHPDSIESATKLLSGLFEHPGKPFTIYLTLLHKNGKEIQVEGIATNLLHIPGVNALVANFRDITERKKNEKRIHESEELYKNLFNKSPLPMWVCDAASYQFLEINDAAIQHYGYTRKEFLKLNAFDITSPEDHEALKRLLISGPRTVHQRLLRKQVKKNNELIYVEVLTHLIKYKGRDSYLIVANDITEKVRLRHQLMEEKIFRQREIMRAAIDAQEKEREEIGRELHDNVTQILTTARLCLSCVEDNNQQPDAMVLRTSDIIAGAIEEIRKLSKSMTQAYHKEIGLQLSIEDLAESIRLATKFQIMLEFSLPDEQHLDDKLKMTIFRIAQEQLNNILKHASATQVTISVTQTEDTVQLYITDNGKGFNMQEKRNGIGIMNIINRAEIFNGRVDLDSSPGKGCRMLVNFKVATA